MSEYQYVEFLAVDGPLNDKQLAFAQKQSSRAEVTRWTLSCEYNYSSFRGDVDGLLRQGYDIYLQYANYGDREIKLRLPAGLPFGTDVWSQYMIDEQLSWSRDTNGSGGIITVSPYHESGALDEVWEFDEYLDAAVWVRDRLIQGDLRALYALWLCAAYDDNYDPAEMIEPPVPHGIAGIAAKCRPLLWFFGLDPLVLVAAGEGVPDAPAEGDQEPIGRWIAGLDEPSAKELLRRLLAGDTPSEKARILAEMRSAQTSDAWPTTDKRRSLDELLQRTEPLRAEERAKQVRKAKAKAKRKAEKAERQRAQRIKEMAEDPEKWLREADRLVEIRGTVSYAAAAEILKDLREAIGGDEGDKVARGHAAKLMKKYPTLHFLKSSLRKRGLLE